MIAPRKKKTSEATTARCGRIEFYAQSQFNHSFKLPVKDEIIFELFLRSQTFSIHGLPIPRPIGGHKKYLRRCPMRINIIGSTGKMDGNATEYSLIPQSIIDFWRMNVTDSHPFSTQSQHVQLPKSALQIEQWISRCRSPNVARMLSSIYYSSTHLLSPMFTHIS